MTEVEFEFGFRIFDLIPLGSPCIVLGSVEGIVTGYAVTGSNLNAARIQYQVSWLDGNQRCSEWIELCEVKEKEVKQLERIGFAKFTTGFEPCA